MYRSTKNFKLSSQFKFIVHRHSLIYSIQTEIFILKIAFNKTGKK